jgi:hypothetical protein
MYNVDRWKLVADLNYNGEVTISDVWLWFQWFYFLPGDGLYSLIMSNDQLATFFELSTASYGNFLSGTISFFVWGPFLFLMLLGALFGD